MGRGRGVRLLLSRRFYSHLGKAGVYTRKRGLGGGNKPAAMTKVFFDSSGMPIDPVRKFPGHENLETTQIYAESSPAMNRESYEGTSGPRSQTGSREEEE